jgi:hypothetical protein
MSLTGKRICAYLLDVFLIYVFLTLLVNIRYLNPYYEKYNESYTRYNEIVEKYYNKEISFEEMQEQNMDNYYDINRYSISNNIEIVVVLFLYFVMFQKYNNGQTLGKKIMKIKVVGDNKTSIWRYLLRMLPMYFILVGGIIPLIINSSLILLLSKEIYLKISQVVTYVFLGIGIIDFVMITMNKDKKGLHDIISKTTVELIEKDK